MNERVPIVDSPCSLARLRPRPSGPYAAATHSRLSRAFSPRAAPPRPVPEARRKAEGSRSWGKQCFVKAAFRLAAGGGGCSVAEEGPGRGEEGEWWLGSSRGRLQGAARDDSDEWISR